MNIKTHGGVRQKAGRKPIEDKKKTVSIYIRESIIKKLGGPEIVKELATKYINSKGSKK